MMKMATTETTLTTRTWRRAHAIWLSTSLRSMVTSITPRTFCDLGWAWHAAEEQPESLYMGLMIPRTRWFTPRESSLCSEKKMRLRSDVASRSSGRASE